MQIATGAELDSYFEQFRDNMRTKVKESGSRLRNAIENEGGYRGEGARPLMYIDVPDARENTDPAGPTPIMGHSQEDRWLYPHEWEFGDLITKREIIEQMSDPTSKIYQAAMRSMRRYEQFNVIMPAFFADAKYGKRGEKTASFNATDYDRTAATIGHRVNVQVGSPSASPADIGITQDKLKYGLEILYKEDVLLDDDDPDEQVYCGCSAAQNTEMVTFAEINKDNYIEKPVIKNGKVISWMGIMFEHSNQWTKSGNNRLLPMWVKSGMHLGTWTEMDGFLRPNPSYKNNPHLYLSQRKAAVRTDEKKVIQIPCKEAA